MSESRTGSAERGYPIWELGPPRIFLAEGRIGAVSILDNRDDVERILGVERRSLWGVREESPPPVVLQMVFLSDEEWLYDQEEMLLKVREINDLVSQTPGFTGRSDTAIIPFPLEVLEGETCEALRPDEDGLVELALTWPEPLEAPDPGSVVPMVVFADGATLPCVGLRIPRLIEGLGEPVTVEDCDDVILYEWAAPDFVIVATAEHSGLVSELGFSTISLRDPALGTALN